MTSIMSLHKLSILSSAFHSTETHVSSTAEGDLASNNFEISANVKQDLIKVLSEQELCSQVQLSHLVNFNLILGPALLAYQFNNYFLKSGSGEAAA